MPDAKAVGQSESGKGVRNLSVETMGRKAMGFSHTVALVHFTKGLEKDYF